MRRLLALLLALVLAVGLAGCGTTTGDPSSAPSSNPSSAPSDSGGAGDETVEPGTVKLPIVDTMTEFSIWCNSPSVKTGMTTNAESLGYLEVEEKTNIRINFLHTVSTQAQEQFNLIVASNEYPDSFYAGSSFYIGGLDKFIDDEIIIDIKDIAEQFCPNYLSRRTVDEQTERDTKTDTGNWPGFYRIKQTIQPTWLGVTTRKDLLDRYNIEKPETYDDYEAMFEAFKQDENVVNPLTINYLGLDETYMAGFGVKDGYLVIDGKVQYGPALDGFGDYIKKMADWFSKGIIDADFYTRSGILMDGVILTGEVTTWNTVYTFFTTLGAQSDIEGYQLTALTPPVQNKGDTRNFVINYQITSRLDQQLSTITTSCKDPETFAKYMDYFFTEEGGLYVDYGIEGLSWEYVNGKPTFSALVMEDLSGAPIEISGKYNINGVTSWYDWERELVPTLGEEGLAALTTWDKNFVDAQSMPNVTLTADESREYAALYNDIQTFVRESAAAFITGTKPLTELDAYFNQIRNAMNLDTVLKHQQAALDRYNNR